MTTGGLLLAGCADPASPVREAAPALKKLVAPPLSYDSLACKACAYLQVQQARCDSAYHFSEYDHWYYDQATGLLTFTDAKLPKLVIEYEEVGSVSEKSDTWLWAWDNDDTEPKVRSEIGRVRRFGQQHGKGFERLTEPLWPAKQQDGWNMTAIAAYLLRAKGAYRVPSPEDSLYSFMIFKKIRPVGKTGR